MTALAEIVEGRELLWNLTLRELRSKYKRSALGWFWSMLNPLSSVAIYGVVFGVLFGLDAPPGDPSRLNNFALYLSCALLPWNFLTTSLGASTGAIVGNSNLLKKVYFPREYVIIATVFSWVVSFLIELSVLGVALWAFGHFAFQWTPMVLLLVALQTVLVMGYSLFLGAVNVYFRDMQHLIGIVLQVWFYLTPIVYVLNKYIPEHRVILGVNVPVRTLYLLNPMVHVVTGFRNVLYDGRMPGLRSMVYLLVVSFAVFFAGWAFFRKVEGRMVEEL
jgi:ABC-type polysaccharide/polyol phosphate export permease